MTDQTPAMAHWTLDKRIPVALIVALVAQAITFGWMASALNSRVENLETYVADSKIATAAQVSTERDRGDRLIRVETLMESIQRSVTNIERKLDNARPDSRATRPD